MEQTTTTTVTDRWFQAYDDLILTGRTSQRKMCEELGVDRRNFCQQKKDHTRRILRVEWLETLVLKYGVSAEWLLTGRGWPWG